MSRCTVDLRTNHWMSLARLEPCWSWCGARELFHLQTATSSLTSFFRPRLLRATLRLLSSAKDAPVPHVRCAALNALKRLGAEGPEALAIVSLHLESPDNMVRWASFNTLKALNDDHAASVSRVCRLFTHDEPGVRSFALRALAQHAENDGDEHVASAVAISLEDEFADVRNAAQVALTTIIRVDDASAVARIASYLGSTQPGTYRQTVNTLASIAKKGNVAAISAVVGHLGFAYEPVLRAAVESVVSKRKRDQHVQNGVISATTSALVLCLRHEHPSVRNVALNALTSIVSRGDPKAVDGATRCVHDSDPGVRACALLVLAEISQTPSDPAKEAALECLNDSVIDVRCASIAALRDVSRCGDAAVVSAMCTCLADVSPCVRCAAARCLLHIAMRGDDEAIYALEACERLETDVTAHSAVCRALLHIQPARAAHGSSPVGAEAFTITKGERCPSLGVPDMEVETEDKCQS